MSVAIFSPVAALWTKERKQLVKKEAMEKEYDRLNKVDCNMRVKVLGRGRN